jgi:hypothetical protein
MPTETLEPNSCDKTTSGWDACGFCSVSGGSESCNCSAASTCSDGSVHSSGARFHNFDSPSHQGEWDDCQLKVAWKLYGETGDDSASCVIHRAYLQYSTNGGSGWNNFPGFPKNATGSNQSGTATHELSTGQNIANVQVRMYVQVQSCDPCAGGSTDECCETIEGTGKEFCYCIPSCSTGCSGGDCEEGAC